MVRQGGLYGGQLVSLPGGQQAIVRCALPGQSTMVQLAPPQSMFQLAGAAQPMVQLGQQSMMQLGPQSIVQLGAPMQQYMQMQVPVSTAGGSTIFQTVQIPVQMQPQQQQARLLSVFFED
jgi:hypothetical protein